MLGSAHVNFNEKPPTSTVEFMEQFSKITNGTRIYTMKAMRHPEDTQGFIIGDVITTDQCLTSHFGDTKLFFKHQGVEEDIALRPEWSDAYFHDCSCNYPSKVKNEF